MAQPVAASAISGAIAALRAELGDVVKTDDGVRAAYRHDQCAFAQSADPAAVVNARSESDVCSTMRVADEHGVPVVPRGAGSGLSGGACGIDGGITLVTAALDRVIDVDRDNLLATVGPGVITADLKAAAADVGLDYPPDPASSAFCTIGGNVATNAGGLCCVKYGVTRDSVLGLRLVRPGGDTVQLGRRTLKSSAGLDLTSLVVGSEGTLGVISEVTVRLRPARPQPRTLIAFLPTLHAAGEAIAAIRKALVPSMLEVMDRTTVRAVEEWQHLGLDVDAAAMLLVQSDIGGDAGTEELAVVARICEAGGGQVMTADDPLEADLLLQARRLAFPALERMGSVLLDDVGVPCAAIPRLLDAIEETARRTDLSIGTFGHAGDGNMHPTIVFADDTDGRSRAMEAFDSIVRAALALGGTTTGEHGIGSLKHRYLSEEFGAGSLDLQRAVRRAFDPNGICNPGRAL